MTSLRNVFVLGVQDGVGGTSYITSDNEAAADRLLDLPPASIGHTRSNLDALTTPAYGLCVKVRVNCADRDSEENLPFRNAPHFTLVKGEVGSVAYKGNAQLAAFKSCLDAALQAKILAKAAEAEAKGEGYIFVLGVEDEESVGGVRFITADNEAAAARVLDLPPASIGNTRSNPGALTTPAYAACLMKRVNGADRESEENLPFRNAPHFKVPKGKLGSLVYKGNAQLAAFKSCLDAALQAKREAKAETASRLELLEVAIATAGGVCTYAVDESNNLECHTHPTLDAAACFFVAQELASEQRHRRAEEECAGEEGDEDEEEKAAIFNSRVTSMKRRILRHMLPSPPSTAPSSSFSSSSSFPVQPSSRDADGMEKVFCGWVTRIKGQAPPLQRNIPMGACFQGVGERIRDIQQATVRYSAAACDFTKSPARTRTHARLAAAGKIIGAFQEAFPTCPFMLKPTSVVSRTPAIDERIAQISRTTVHYPTIAQTPAQAANRKRLGLQGAALGIAQDGVFSALRVKTAVQTPASFMEVEALLHP